MTTPPPPTQASAGPSLATVADFNALCRAAHRAAKGKRLTHASARFLCDLEQEVLALRTALLDGSYRPAPYRTFHIVDPKPRTISAAAFRDRVVHHALCTALEPLFESVAIDDSYACRVGRGLTRALARLRALTHGGGWFVKLDIEHFFETAHHAVLLRALDGLVADPGLRWLAARFVSAGAPGAPTGRGLPIGNLTSQHFANFYLTALDHHIQALPGVRGYLRYMDDLVLFVADGATARAAHGAVRRFVEDTLQLRLKDSAHRQGPVYAGVPFLGFRVWPALVRFDAARQRRWRRKMAAAVTAAAQSATTDTAEAAVAEARAHQQVTSLVAWSGHAHAQAFRQSWFRRRTAEVEAMR